MWFCHNHNDDEESLHNHDNKTCPNSENKNNTSTTHKNGKVPSKHKTKLLPKEDQCLVGETYVLLARKHVEHSVVMVTDSHEVMCSRCRLPLGNVLEGRLVLRPKKNLCLGQPDPTYRNRPTLDFLYENTVVVFRWGLYN